MYVLPFTASLISPLPPPRTQTLTATLSCPGLVWFGLVYVAALAALVWFIFREIYNTDGSPDIFRLVICDIYVCRF